MSLLSLLANQDGLCSMHRVHIRAAMTSSSIPTRLRQPASHSPIPAFVRIGSKVSTGTIVQWI
jgi:hypothetical protein